MLKKIPFIMVAALMILLIITPCFADNDHGKHQESSAVDAFLFPIQIFRNYISGADGNRCPMHPSCSTYSMEALKKHGPLMGWVMTCDRLLRCGRDELKLSPSIMVRGKTRTYDPVSNNDFWWD